MIFSFLFFFPARGFWTRIDNDDEGWRVRGGRRKRGNPFLSFSLVSRSSSSSSGSAPFRPAFLPCFLPVSWRLSLLCARACNSEVF